jgi:hypothetical protein
MIRLANIFKEVKIQTPEITPPLDKQILNHLIKSIVKYIEYANIDMFTFLLNDDYYGDIIKEYIYEQMKYNHYDLEDINYKSDESIESYIKEHPELKQYVNKKALEYYLKSINLGRMVSDIKKEVKEKGWWSGLIDNYLDSDQGQELFEPYFEDFIYKNFDFESYLIKMLNQSDLFTEVVKISAPARIHDLDKPGVKFENIKIGDILQFTLYQPQIETVRQKVIGFKQDTNPMHDVGDILISQDLDDYGELRSGTDYWVKFSIENYWEGKPSNIKENIIREYPESKINSLLIKWGIDSTKDQAKANIARQLINRFDQIKGSLNDKLDIVIIPNEIKNKDVKDIDLYSFEDLQKLINSYPENPEKSKKEAINRFVEKFGIDKPTAQSYTARFMAKRDALKFGVRDGIEELGLTKEDVLSYIPKKLQQNDAFLDPRNWGWQEFEQMLDALFPSQKQVSGEDINLAETDADKIYNKNGIEIYKGDDVHKCISYNPISQTTKRKKYGWCVTQIGNTNYDYYRFGDKAPTFYFIFDRSKPSTPEHASFDDKWHAFVIQVNKDNNSYIVTSANNDRDAPAKSWEDISNIVPKDTWEKIKNLKDYFKPISLSSTERGRKFASGKNLSLDEFKELSQDEKILYVQGKASKNALTSEILAILPKYKISLEGRSTTLANVAIDSGQKFPYSLLKDYESLAKRYAIFRFRHTNYSKDPIPLPYVQYLDEPAKETYLSKFGDNVSFELIDQYFGQNLLEKSVNEQVKELGFISPEYIKYIKDPKLRSLYESYSKLYGNWFKGDNFNNEEAISNMTDMPEQVITPVYITYDQWEELSSTEKNTLLKLTNKVNGNDKFSTFLYAAPYIIKDGSKEYILLPTSVDTSDYLPYKTWVLVDKNNNIIKDNINGEESKIGDEQLGYGYFTSKPKRVYSMDDTNLVTGEVNETEKLYEDWDKYQLMIRAGIIK